MGKREAYGGKGAPSPAALKEVQDFVDRVRAQQDAKRAAAQAPTPPTTPTKAPTPAKRPTKSTRAGD